MDNANENAIYGEFMNYKFFKKIVMLLLVGRVLLCYNNGVSNTMFIHIL